MAEFIVRGRFTFVGPVLVKAADADKAVKNFDAGKFEVDTSALELVDWERRGKPETA